MSSRQTWFFARNQPLNIRAVASDQSQKPAMGGLEGSAGVDCQQIGIDRLIARQHRMALQQGFTLSRER